MTVSNRRSSASSTPIARTCGASWSPPWAATRPTTASRRRSWPRCAPIRGCARDNPRAWVLTIAHRKALDHFRARKRRAVPVGDDLPDVAAPPDPEPRDDGVWARVDALPPKQRGAVLLRFAGDLSHREVAAALGVSEEAARRNAFEGLRKLRQEMTHDRGPPRPARVRPRRRRGRGRALRRHRARPTSPTRWSTRPSARWWPPATPRGLATLSYEDHSRRHRRASSTGSRPGSRRASSRRPRAWTTCAASSTSTSRGAGATSTCPIDWALASPFGRRVLKATAAIPFGAVRTYGEMAAQAGNPKASRAAGRALGANPIPIVVPCHRVIGAERAAHRLHRRPGPQGGAAGDRGRRPPRRLRQRRARRG